MFFRSGFLLIFDDFLWFFRILETFFGQNHWFSLYKSSIWSRNTQTLSNSISATTWTLGMLRYAIDIYSSRSRDCRARYSVRTAGRDKIGRAVSLGGRFFSSAMWNTLTTDCYPWSKVVDSGATGWFWSCSCSGKSCRCWASFRGCSWLAERIRAHVVLRPLGS